MITSNVSKCYVYPLFSLIFFSNTIFFFNLIRNPLAVMVTRFVPKTIRTQNVSPFKIKDILFGFVNIFPFKQPQNDPFALRPGRK